MLEYQASQKNVAAGSRKYLNRYPFSGKIECMECGDTFKRRIHTSTHSKYIAWCCSTHIKNKDECSMLFIREERIHQAFITMMNKLKFGYSYVLRSEEHTSELQSRGHLVCRLLLEKKKIK